MASAQNEVIKKFFTSLKNYKADEDAGINKIAALNEAVRACSNFNGIQDVIDKMIEDCKNSSSGYVFLKKYCDINLYNDDTGAITGSDAGGSTVKNAKDIMPESGEAKFPTGKTVKVGDVEYIEFEVENLKFRVRKNGNTKAEQAIINGFYTWWAADAVKLIKESFGLDFSGESKSYMLENKTISLGFNYHEKDMAAAFFSGNDIVITQFSVNPNVTDSNDISLTADLDGILAHELTHGASEFHFSVILPQFLNEGMAELIRGIDLDRSYTMLSLANNPEDLKNAIDLDDTGTGNGNAYNAGYIFLRYLAKQGASIVDSAEKQSNYKRVDLSSKDDDLNVAALNEKNLTIVGGKGNDLIDDSFNENPVVFEYAQGDGDDTIEGYNENDTIKLTSGQITGHSFDGNDIIVKIGSGSIRIVDGAGKDINFVGANGNSFKENRITTSDNGNIINYVSGDGDEIINAFNANDTIKITNAKVDSYKFDGRDLILKIGSNSITLKGGRFIGTNIFDVNGKVSIIHDYKSSGSAGNDIIYINSSNYSINSGGGNDTIYFDNTTGNIIEYESGEDLIIGFDESDAIKILNGEIINSSIQGNNLILTTNKGKITLEDYRFGDIKVINSNGESKIYGNAGIYNINNNTLISTGNGFDSIGNQGDKVTINSSNGNDTINNYGDNVTINAGDGDDSIYSDGYKDRTFKDEDGNIWHGTKNSSNVIINASNGSDTINVGSSEAVIEYRAGDGDDYIIGFGDDDTLRLIDVTVTGFEIDDYDSILKLTGGGSIRISNSRNEGFNIIDSNGNYYKQYFHSGYLENYNSNVELKLAEGKNYITNYGDDVFVKFGGGNDTFYNYANFNKETNIYDFGGTIDGGAGNDYIHGGELVFGGEGDDTLQGITVYGGNGNDQINEGKLIFGEDGNDSIYSNYTDATIDAGNGNDYIQVSYNSTIIGGKGDDTIDVVSNEAQFIQYNAGDGNDVITQFGSNDTLAINDDIISGSLKDNEAIIKIGTGSITLKNIEDTKIKILNNGKLIETIFGGAYIYNSEDNTLITGTYNDDTIRSYDSSHVTINTGLGNDSIKNDSESSIINAGAGNDTIIDSSYTITINSGDGDDYIEKTYYHGVINAGAGNDYINLIKIGNVTVNAGTGNDTIKGYFDVLKYAKGDGNDLIYDYNYLQTIWLTNTTYSKIKAVGKDIILTVGNENITLKGCASYERITIKDSSGKYELHTDGSKRIENQSKNAKLIGTKYGDYINNYVGRVSISTGEGNDVIHNKPVYGSKVTSAGDYVTIDAGSGNDYVDNQFARALIYGGKGTDIIDSSGANSTIIAGDGYDWITSSGNKSIINGGKNADRITIEGAAVIQYAAGDGNDTIVGYNSKDTIQITGGKYSTQTSGKDTIIKVGSGSMRLVNAKGIKLNITDNTNVNTKPTSNNTTTTKTLNLTDTSSATIKATSIYKNINASTRTKAINITGNALANSIVGGKNSDTLYGGKGNDTLKGGTGKDVFVYSTGDGKDVITDYTAGQDKIKINKGTISKYAISGDDVVFTIGTGTLTVKNAKTKRISITDANNKTTTKNYSTSKSYSERNYWFIDDNNFNSSELDSITKISTNDYSVGEIYTSNNLTQLMNNLTVTKSNRKK